MFLQGVFTISPYPPHWLKNFLFTYWHQVQLYFDILAFALVPIMCDFSFIATQRHTHVEIFPTDKKSKHLNIQNIFG